MRALRAVALLSVALALAAPVRAQSAADHPKSSEETPPERAVATIEPVAGTDLSGEISLERTGDFVRIHGAVHGLSKGKHGLHVHAGRSCSDRGGHFDPAGNPHGSPDEPSSHRHLGDLGNLVSEGDTARYERIDRVVELQGEHSVVGRVLVVHQGEDQYIPQPSGSAGTEIGCGVIEAVVR